MLEKSYLVVKSYKENRSIFVFLFYLLETMLRVRLRCSRVWRINHQKCVTFLPIAQPLILSPQNCPLLFHCPKGLPLLLLVSLISTPEHWWLSNRLPASSTFPKWKGFKSCLFEQIPRLLVSCNEWMKYLHFCWMCSWCRSELCCMCNTHCVSAVVRNRVACVCWSHQMGCCKLPVGNN